MVVRRENLAKPPWTAREAKWIRDHVGIIFYPEGPQQYQFPELMDMAHELGVRQVKTWLKGWRSGEMAEKLNTPDYQRLLREFDTVLFDVCPDFIHKPPYDDAWLKTAHDEYEGVAYHLSSHYCGTGKTFLLSLFMETNLYFGNRRSHVPDFPLDRFFSQATQGVRDGIARAKTAGGDGELPKIYTVIEMAGLQRDFIARYLPNTHADLYAISYYGRGELGQPDVTLAECIRAVSTAVPHDGPFGKDNIILGELGHGVFNGGNSGEDREQLAYLRKTISVAREHRLPYAFIFWLADAERHLNDCWGFVTSKPTGGQLRRSWHAFQSAFDGHMQDGQPTKTNPAIEVVRARPWNPKPGQRVSLEVDVSDRSTWTAAASPIKANLQLTAGSHRSETAVSLAADELVTLRASFPAPLDNQVTITLTGAGIESVTKAVSLDRADLVIDRIYTDPAEPKPGDEIRLFAVVRNLGRVPITDFSVSFHVDDFKDQWVTWGCIWGETKLAPGQSLPIGGGFLWKATPGVHTIRAWANPDGSREADYRNNIRFQKLTVR